MATTIVTAAIAIVIPTTAAVIISIAVPIKVAIAIFYAAAVTISTATSSKSNVATELISAYIITTGVGSGAGSNILSTSTTHSIQIGAAHGRRPVFIATRRPVLIVTICPIPTFAAPTHSSTAPTPCWSNGGSWCGGSRLGR